MNLFVTESTPCFFGVYKCSFIRGNMRLVKSIIKSFLKRFDARDSKFNVTIESSYVGRALTKLALLSEL
jgi:hypothetical protein